LPPVWLAFALGGGDPFNPAPAVRLLPMSWLAQKPPCYVEMAPSR
jgi:hypothetical protein